MTKYTRAEFMALTTTKDAESYSRMAASLADGLCIVGDDGCPILTTCPGSLGFVADRSTVIYHAVTGDTDGPDGQYIWWTTERYGEIGWTTVAIGPDGQIIAVKSGDTDWVDEEDLDAFEDCRIANTLANAQALRWILEAA